MRQLLLSAALAAALSGSVAAPLLAKAAYSFGPPEYFALAIFGLSMLAWFIHPGFFVLATTGVVLVLYAVQSAPISHVAPAREVSMLFAALIGGRLLGEGDRALRIAGAVMIALGVTALGLG